MKRKAFNTSSQADLLAVERDMKPRLTLDLSSSVRGVLTFRILCAFCTFLLAGGTTMAQVSEVDSRRIDEVIFLDISGSMVRDIRTALLKAGYAKGQTDYDLFRMTGDVMACLRDARIQGVVTNNLLYKTIRYVEALIDQPGSRRIFLATFDDGLRLLGNAPFPQQTIRGVFGPYDIERSDSDTNSPTRRAIKSFLAPDRYGPYDAMPQWRGILPEAVLKGSGPTAIHGTSRVALDLLDKLVTPGYTNSTRQQRLILFTDGIEEKDKHIPFTTTVDYLERHFRNLERYGIGFEFNKYYILQEGERPPAVVKLEDDLLRKKGLGEVKWFRPRILRVTSLIDKALSGKLKLPKSPNTSATVALSPSIRFGVGADDQQPVSAKLVFRAKGQEFIRDLSVEVTPSQVATDASGQVLDFSLAFSGPQLNEFVRSGLRRFDKLILHWELLVPAEGKSGQESSEAFYGTDRWPISLELVPPFQPLAVRCVQPAGVKLDANNQVEIPSAQRSGTLAIFEADFSQIEGAAALLVRCSESSDKRWAKLSSGNADELTISKSATGADKADFSLSVDAPPGADKTIVSLGIVPQNQWLVPTPSNITVVAVFEPSTIETEWSGEDGQSTAQPAEIDLGECLMEPVEAPDASVIPEKKPSVDTIGLTLPDRAITPAAECKLIGNDAGAFRLIAKGDASAFDGSLIERSIRLCIQPSHVFIKSDRQVVTNLSATLEIRPKANFVFAPSGGGAARPGSKLIAVPLRMTAIIPAPTEIPK